MWEMCIHWSLLVALVEGGQELLEHTGGLQEPVSTLLHDFRKGSHRVGDDLDIILFVMFAWSLE